MKVKVIGAGLGGLAASCLLASRGHDVEIFEKNTNAGGKINQVQAKGFQFDTGPSLLTMPFILEKLFKECGADINNYLEIIPLSPICRYFYPDNTQFDCYQETERNLAQIQQFAPEDVEAYKNFQHRMADLYKRIKDAFLFNPLFDRSDLSSLNFTDFFKIDAFKTVSGQIDQTFNSPKLRKFFKRYATYNGSSPFQASATFNVIPHIEHSFGGFYINKGIYMIIKGLTDLCKELGVRFFFNQEIKKIGTQGGKVTHIRNADGAVRQANIVVANTDASETYLHLLDDSSISFLKKKKIKSLEPSCSGFVLLLGIDKKYRKLEHHNIFFSDDYEQEFKQIFEQKIMPDDPTIYISKTASVNPEHAPKGGDNLFVLVNAPYLSKKYNWEQQEERYKKQVINKLEERCLVNLGEHIIYSKTINPQDFYNLYRSNKGSIYGTSSNTKLAAFMRPKNKSRAVNGLYLVGGSTHPGGGIPLVTLSAFHAVELIDRYE